MKTAIKSLIKLLEHVADIVSATPQRTPDEIRADAELKKRTAQLIVDIITIKQQQGDPLYVPSTFKKDSPRNFSSHSWKGIVYNHAAYETLHNPKKLLHAPSPIKRWHKEGIITPRILFEMMLDIESSGRKPYNCLANDIADYFKKYYHIELFTDRKNGKI